MNYFRLLDKVGIPNRWHIGEILSDGVDVSDLLTEGIPFVGRTPLVADLSYGGIALPLSFTSFAVPVAHERVGGAIEAVTSAVQRLRLEIPGLRDYEVLNAVESIDCLDESRSEFLKWTKADGRPDRLGQYRSVTELRLDRARIPRGADWFRVKKWEIALIVSSDVRRVLEEQQVASVTFHAV